MSGQCCNLARCREGAVLERIHSRLRPVKFKLGLSICPNLAVCKRHPSSCARLQFRDESVCNANNPASIAVARRRRQIKETRRPTNCRSKFVAGRKSCIDFRSQSLVGRLGLRSVQPVFRRSSHDGTRFAVFCVCPRRFAVQYYYWHFPGWRQSVSRWSLTWARDLGFPNRSARSALHWDAFAASICRALEQRVDFYFLPPGDFIAALMKLAMVTTAERNGEFIADFEPQCARLRKTYMMRVTGVASADQAGLGGDKAQMRFIATALRFR